MQRFFLCLSFFLLLFVPVQAAENVVVQPVDTGEALVNPGMGWTMHFYSNIPENYGSKLEPSDTLDWFPGCSVVYLRLPWAFIEPEEGVFNWAILDTPAERWIAKGKKVAFRFTCCESWLRWATPEWVARAGAHGVEYEFGVGPREGGPLWAPLYDDPVFLEKLDRFLVAVARRYNGNPDVAFLDAGTFGMWGEGHTGFDCQLSQEETDRVSKIHIDLHKKHFPDTLLCVSDDISGPTSKGPWPGMEYALSQDVTFRDDSILVQKYPEHWYHAEMAAMFWPRLPIILEHEHFGSSKIREAWGDGSLLRQAVEDHHASYLSIHWWPEVLLEENREVIEEINRRLGYRLQLRQLRYPKTVVIGEPFTVDWQWANAGVAPCYGGGFPALTLKDEKGGFVSVLADETLDVKTLPVGPPGEARAVEHQSNFRIGFVAPTTRPGVYDLYISVGRRDGKPEIALPLPDNDGTRRYKIGRIELIGK